MISKSCASLICFVFAGLCLSLSIPPRDEGPTAHVGNAIYVGATYPTYGVDFWAGIRYAKPPIGPLRLQPPREYEAEGIVPSQAFGNRCFQIETTGGNQSEDCLTLNIFTPPQSFKKKQLPVMFWIHGGGFNQGSGIDYGGESLVNRSIELHSPVIVVTINYRLSFFGFSGSSIKYRSTIVANFNQPARMLSPTTLSIWDCLTSV